MDSTILQWTSLICGALNGWSSIMIECTLTVLSVIWFPTQERTTATGIVIATQMAGLIPPAMLFPRIVTEPNINETNCTGNRQLAADITAEVSWILYTEAAIAGVIFLAMLCYFPGNPPSPPSPSASSERFNVLKGLRNIFTSSKNMLIGKYELTSHSNLT